jgi:uncharacterized membrane protein YfcA
MIHFIIGSIIGLVMGLTGAGGALVSLPLFMTFLGMDLKVASVFSLIAVVVASVANFFSQKGNVHYRLSFIIVLSSGVGSLLTAPFKVQLPEAIIAILLVIVSLYALVNVWRSQSEANPDLVVESSILKSIPLGLLLGALTTFTGLGGGVMLVPVFLRVFKLNQDDAIINSLFAVGLSSVLSFLIQLQSMQNLDLDATFLFLAAGIVVAATLVKLGLKSLTQDKVILTRRLVFTGVVIYSTVRIFIKG